VSIWHAHSTARSHTPAHHITVQDVAIFAGGTIFAVFIGIAATGLLPV